MVTRDPLDWFKRRQSPAPFYTKKKRGVEAEKKGTEIPKKIERKTEKRVIPKKRTNVEIIKARERKTADLMRGGMGEKRAREQATIEVRQEIREPELAARELEEAKPEVAAALEAAGAFEEVTPRETSLAPITEAPPVPILGPAVAGISESILENAYINGWLDKQFPKAPVGEEAFPMPITPETLREATLREIRNEAFKEGLKLSETFGSFVEAIPIGVIPIVGSEAEQYITGLVEDPFSNAMQVKDELMKTGETATNNQEKTRSGVMPAGFAMARARQMEEEIAALEGRLKLLIMSSPRLQASTDEVNKIQLQILDAKIRTDNFRTAASFALTADLSGTGRVVPTDEQLYFELKEYKEGK